LFYFSITIGDPIFKRERETDRQRSGIPLTLIYFCSCERFKTVEVVRFIIVFIIYIGQGKFQDTKGETEAVNQRTNNIMVKRKGVRGCSNC
jgi:hypothetical protein